MRKTRSTVENNILGKHGGEGVRSDKQEGKALRGGERRGGGQRQGPMGGEEDTAAASDRGEGGAAGSGGVAAAWFVWKWG